MGSAALAKKRAGKRRLGPQERIVTEIEKNISDDTAAKKEQARLASQNARQKLYWITKVESDAFREPRSSGL